MANLINLGAKLNANGLIVRMHRPIIRENTLVSLRSYNKIFANVGWRIVNKLQSEDLIIERSNNQLYIDVNKFNEVMEKEENFRFLQWCGFKTRETENMKDLPIQEAKTMFRRALLSRMMKETDENYTLRSNFKKIEYPSIAEKVDVLLEQFKNETKNELEGLDYCFISGLLMTMFVDYRIDKSLPQPSAFTVLKSLKTNHDPETFLKYSKFAQKIADIFNELFFVESKELNKKILIDFQNAGIIFAKVYALSGLDPL